jgi:CelD/BcsL family acetyltransferase involved in cellulose biosynthesis
VHVAQGDQEAGQQGGHIRQPGRFQDPGGIETRIPQPAQGVTIVRSSVKVEGFGSLQPHWEAMLDTCFTNTVFVTPQWQKAWWRNFGGEWELQLLSVWDGSEIAGIAPLMQKDGVLSFVGGDDLFDYHDFLVPQGKEDFFYTALFDYLLEMDWHTLSLTSLPHSSPTLSALPAMARERGLAVAIAEGEATPVLSLPPSWEEYVAGLSKKSRHELRRKLRRLDGADNARQYLCDSVDEIVCCMKHFFRLMRASSPQKDEFLDSARERFFVDIATELAPTGQFKLYFLEVGGVSVASCICIDYGESYLLYNSGYDPGYSDLSVGLLNKALCIREAIEEGRGSFNFLKGTERYKYDLGGRDQAVCHMSLSR